MRDSYVKYRGAWVIKRDNVANSLILILPEHPDAEQSMEGHTPVSSIVIFL